MDWCKVESTGNPWFLPVIVGVRVHFHPIQSQHSRYYGAKVSSITLPHKNGDDDPVSRLSATFSRKYIPIISLYPHCITIGNKLPEEISLIAH
jgi:hypothetical protein